MLIDELESSLSRIAAVDGRSLERDDEAERESLVVACESVGVAPEQYQSALKANGNLYQLHRCAVGEAICGTTDPGPYDRISRESPSGTEKNEHLNEWMLRGNSP